MIIEVAKYPKDDYLYLVLRSLEDGTMPYIIHTYNSETGGFSGEIYCKNLRNAAKIFDDKAKRWKCTRVTGESFLNSLNIR